MNVAGHEFEGPYEIGKKVVDRAAVYVILDAQNHVIDVGQSGEAGTRLLNHDRKLCWDRHDGKRFVLKWMPTTSYSIEDRIELETSIRLKYNPLCGKK